MMFDHAMKYPSFADVLNLSANESVERFFKENP